ncbi:MAG: hypothetical protein IPG53_15665 [Ignavibacteriales bacterium]|nr:hypothetical protein [Ignavibacteriales bacterium]
MWEGEPGDTRTMTYLQLHSGSFQICKCSPFKGSSKRDRVIIYMGMVPETAVALLACARIGAIHSAVLCRVFSEL